MAPAGQSIRPAHPSGPTFCTYTPNGRKLVTVGSNNTMRVFETGSEDEPTNIDDTRDTFTALVVTNDFFVTGSEDGAVAKFSLQTNELEEVLVRCSLPIRHLALSPDRQWLAVASDELTIKIVNVDDMMHVRYIRDLSKPVKHLTFDFNGAYLMTSSTDGNIYVYDMLSEEPELLRKIEGLIPRLETDVQASSAVVWHPDGRAFAAPTATRDIQVMSKRDWEKQRVFSNGHSGDITSLVWAPNGSMLVTAGMDKKICLWDTRTQKVVKRFDDLRAPVWSFSWHPTDNLLSYTTDEGELHIHTDFVPSEYAPLLEKELQPAPFIHDPLAPVSGNLQRQPTNLTKAVTHSRPQRAGTPDSLEEILGTASPSSLDNFVEDDDGEGYAEAPALNGNGKRVNGSTNQYTSSSKRRSAFTPQIHESFQPGSTPWRGNRRYLCLNLLGCVWTLDQDTHHTITVEFYDRTTGRDFHFTDPFGWDKAVLTSTGVLFSSQPKAGTNTPAYLSYRPHETWTTRSETRWELPLGEEISAIAASDSYVIATTNTSYTRVYTLFGTPVSVSRHKSAPIVTCAGWRDYVMTLGNGPIGHDGQCILTYSISHIRRDTLLQNEDTVALPPSSTLISAFWSDDGHPCVYDDTGTLLILQHWRTPGGATWIPLLDSRSLARLAGGRRQERYFPVAVAEGVFHAIILKGGDRYPFFPRPLLSEFGFEIPVAGGVAGEDGKEGGKKNGKSGKAEAEEKEQSETQKLEAKHILLRTLHSLSLPPPDTSTTLTHTQRTALLTQELEIDKTLLQILASECVEGEHTGMKCMELVGLMKDRSGRMLEAAAKVAGRFGREGLRERIKELEERRVVGLEGDDDGEGKEMEE